MNPSDDAKLLAAVQLVPTMIADDERREYSISDQLTQAITIVEEVLSETKKGATSTANINL